MNYAEINSRFDAIFSDPIFQEIRAKLLYYRIIEDSKSTPFSVAEMQWAGTKLMLFGKEIKGITAINYKEKNT